MLQAKASRHTHLAWVAGGLYVLLTALVTVHLTDPVDVAVRQWFRPDDVWGPRQLDADRVVEALSPLRIVPLLPLVAALASVVRRSIEPLLTALVIAAVTLAVVPVTQLLLARPDTHGEVARFSGSYPSGHTAAVLVVLGGCLLVVTRSTPWWLWVPVVLVDLVMGGCLLLEAAHWATDVAGGFLAGAFVLATAVGLRARRRSERPTIAVTAAR